MRYKKTELGQTALHNRALALSPRQRSAFIMFDGKRTVSDVLKATAGLGVTTEDIQHLVSMALLAEVTQPIEPFSAPVANGTVASPKLPSSEAPVVTATDKPVSAPDQANYSRAYPIATRLTAGLGLRGFRLNLAVEAAGDLTKLRELAPKIKDAVGPEKFKELENALYD
jgi:hypothetical protein